ncbi:MAG: DUF302 domain-containing protein [Candidatus Latescibacterota bacterium]
MSYAISKQVDCSYEEAVAKTREALKVEGFGVLTEIDVQATLKKKLDADFRPYCILGACNPPFALRALQAEPNVGLFLPCNVIVQAVSADVSEVAAIDPVAAMAAIENPALAGIASEVKVKLARVIDSL